MEQDADPKMVHALPRKHDFETPGTFRMDKPSGILDNDTLCLIDNARRGRHIFWTGVMGERTVVF
eukprot:6310663-Pyramimonas_sp.AAC.1